ncbi:jg7567, partial [Pararge aegeria aegeria]
MGGENRGIWGPKVPGVVTSHRSTQRRDVPLARWIDDIKSWLAQATQDRSSSSFYEELDRGSALALFVPQSSIAVSVRGDENSFNS